jgi:3-deoxy-D-manno-octulosonate 8-phosphate phosphatase (KDO 8-P phosphatase)
MIKERYPEIETIILDIDGVLTDGYLHVTETGYELVRMNIKDGLGIKVATEAGLTVYVISGASRDHLLPRLARLGIKKAHLGVKDKLALLEKMEVKGLLDRKTTLYMGDDIPDLAAMQACAVSVSPADGALDVRMRASLVTQAKGGEGCVREVLEEVLKAQGKWPVAHFAGA